MRDMPPDRSVLIRRRCATLICFVGKRPGTCRNSSLEIKSTEDDIMPHERLSTARPEVRMWMIKMAESGVLASRRETIDRAAHPSVRHFRALVFSAAYLLKTYVSYNLVHRSCTSKSTTLHYRSSSTFFFCFVGSP